MFDPCAGQESNTAMLDVKGVPFRILDRQQINGLSDFFLDCSYYNAVNVQIEVSGSNPSVDVAVYGAAEAGGTYLPLFDANSSLKAVTKNRSFDCSVGAAYVKMNLTNVSGTFLSGQGITVIVTPYISPAQGNLTIGS